LGRNVTGVNAEGKNTYRMATAVPTAESTATAARIAITLSRLRDLGL
jgi:hypothetical protein